MEKFEGVPPNGGGGEVVVGAVGGLEGAVGGVPAVAAAEVRGVAEAVDAGVVMLPPRVKSSKKKVRKQVKDTSDEAADVSSDSEVASRMTGGKRQKLGVSPMVSVSTDEAVAADLGSAQEEAEKAQREAEDAALVAAEALKKKEAAEARVAVAAAAKEAEKVAEKAATQQDGARMSKATASGAAMVALKTMGSITSEMREVPVGLADRTMQVTAKYETLLMQLLLENERLR